MSIFYMLWYMIHFDGRLFTIIADYIFNITTALSYRLYPENFCYCRDSFLMTGPG